MSEGFAAGKVALITGSSRGIGRELALSLAAQGGSLVVNYKRNAELAAEVAAAAEAGGGRGIAVAMTCVGLARRAQELAVGHAQDRVTFGKPLSARQAIAFALAENAADIEAARQLTLHAARAWEQGSGEAPTLSSMAKLTAVDMLTRVTDKALQAHGGIGFWASSPIERVYRDARAQRFEEGTNEIQKTIIARDVFAGDGQ